MGRALDTGIQHHRIELIADYIHKKTEHCEVAEAIETAMQKYANLNLHRVGQV